MYTEVQNFVGELFYSLFVSGGGGGFTPPFDSNTKGEVSGTGAIKIIGLPKIDNFPKKGKVRDCDHLPPFTNLILVIGLILTAPIPEPSP